MKSCWNNKWWKAVDGAKSKICDHNCLMKRYNLCWRLSLAILSLLQRIKIVSQYWTIVLWHGRYAGWSKFQIGQDPTHQSIRTTRVWRPNNTPCNLRWVHNWNHLIKADPFTPNMWASTNVYYIQNNRDIHKVTLNPFTPKPLFQSQTLLSTKWKKMIEFGYIKYAENTSTH